MTKSLVHAAVLGLAISVGSTPAAAQTLPTDGLVNVNLQNILNNLAVDLNIDRANIPVTAQVPVNVAANVCGVSLNVLSAQIGTGGATCTAVTGSQELTLAVQQQMAAGGTTTGTQTGTTVGSTTTGGTTGTTGGTTGTTGGTTTGTTAGTTTGTNAGTTPGTTVGTGTTTGARAAAPGQQQRAGDVRARDVAPGRARPPGTSAKTRAPGQQVPCPCPVPPQQ